MPPPLDTLAALSGHWITASCACGRTVHLPVKLLAREHGPETRVAAVVARLRCGKCGGRPIEAELRDDVQTSAPGYARGFPSRGI